MDNRGLVALVVGRERAQLDSGLVTRGIEIDEAGRKLDQALPALHPPGVVERRGQGSESGTDRRVSGYREPVFGEQSGHANLGAAVVDVRELVVAVVRPVEQSRLTVDVEIDRPHGGVVARDRDEEELDAPLGDLRAVNGRGDGQCWSLRPPRLDDEPR